jgi:alanine racemase
MVMVKALSYGIGSYEIANLLQHENVDYLGVAFTDEGVELREKGITLPILVMSPDSESFDKIIEYNLEPEIYNLKVLGEFSHSVASNQLPEYPVHIKIDTGMHRLGFLPGEIPDLIHQLSVLKNIKVKAIFSHLAASDVPYEDAFTKFQIKQFNKMAEQFKKTLGYKPLKHLVNSAGIERFPQAHFDMVRLGIGLHGVSCKQKKLKAVSTLKSAIVQIKNLEKGETVGYNRREVLRRDSQIAIIPVGYADGLDRKLGNRNGSVLVKKQKVPYIGDICMDLCMIDITDIPAKEGDEVTIFGAGIPIQKLAEQVNTIPYEILTNVSSRVKRIYINE